MDSLQNVRILLQMKHFQTSVFHAKYKYFQYRDAVLKSGILSELVLEIWRLMGVLN